MEEMIDWFKSDYGEVRVSQGPFHDYLGMGMDFVAKENVQTNIVKFLKKVIKEFPEESQGTAPTQASDHLLAEHDFSDQKLINE